MLTLTGDARIAAHALSATPAWLWSADGSRLIWANAAGAAAFQTTPGAISGMSFDAGGSEAVQIARLNDTLPQGDTPRLERLRGFGAKIGGLLTCLCSRISLDGETAVLVVSLDHATPALAFEDRARALLAAIDSPAALFAMSGKLLAASDGSAGFLDGATSIAALKAEAMAETALRDGAAAGEIGSARLAVSRIGSGGETALLAVFSPVAEPVERPADTPAEPRQTTATAMPGPPPHAHGGVLRFIWQTDADGHFKIDSAEFLRLAGAQTAALNGKTWSDVATALGLDPAGTISQAFATRRTWNSIAVSWPAADGGAIPVELSGLPAFDRERNFLGYRGFGLCRDIEPRNADARPPILSAPSAEQFEIETPKTTPPPAAPAPDSTTIVPFPAPALTPLEQSTFHQLARELGDRLKSTAGKPPLEDVSDLERPETAVAPPPPPVTDTGDERPILDRLPIGILVYRFETLIYANKALLDWTGYRSLGALTAAGGLDSLFIEPAAGPGMSGGGAKALAITSRDGNRKPVEGRLFSVTWEGDSALVLMVNTLADKTRETEADKSQELARREIESDNRNLRAALDTATDGVLLLDPAGRVLFANNGAAALFGQDRDILSDMTFPDLFAPESRRAAFDYLERLGRDETAGILNAGKEMIARTARGELIPLHITVGRIGGDGERFCAVLRDITALKKAEEELTDARQRAAAATAEKSEFLAKISHDIRSPLNAIIGFSEVMMEQRFGPVGNERYQQYIRDIHASGGQLIVLLNELLDLAKIESGNLDLNLTQISLNDITRQAVASLQPEANRARVIIRSSLPPNVPPIVADARTVRQIVLNLLANSIKFTGTGGQVIVSTAIADNNEVVLRVRDTGAGLSDRELLSALEPFRNLATSARWGISGTGLDLPITKALAEANRATFSITSGADRGTLVEVAFPATRVIA